jgi:rhamnose utilization protein RhaD (predicted bifunctional aldolase and dehydrogenase)
MRTSIVQYCKRIGTDSMLVQGGGGNVSWKDNETLWVKASGTCLADAAVKDIFVSVDLSHLQGEISKSNFNVTPRLIGESTLKPSIETLLHALMPQTVVVHLHAIEILAHLVRKEFLQEFNSLLESCTNIRWTSVNYYKPGAELANAVNDSLRKKTDVNVVFLQNHGVVIGGENIEEVDDILKTLIDKLSTVPRKKNCINPPESPLLITENIKFLPVTDHSVHQLAVDTFLFEHLETDWALYPDHVVFLGTYANRYESYELLCSELSNGAHIPELIFLRGIGVFAKPEFSVAKLTQLCCYYDVLCRQNEESILNTLYQEQVAELLNWDAEQYRMSMVK